MSKKTPHNWSSLRYHTGSRIKSRGRETEGERERFSPWPPCWHFASFTRFSSKACGCTLLYVQTPFPCVLKQQYARRGSAKCICSKCHPILIMLYIFMIWQPGKSTSQNTLSYSLCSSQICSNQSVEKKTYIRLWIGASEVRTVLALVLVVMKMIKTFYYHSQFGKNK